MEIDSTLPLSGGGAMPVMGLGTWHLTDDTAAKVERALEVGYRMIDTAADYGTQPGIGEAIGRSDVARDRLFIVAKVEQDEDAYDATAANLDETGLDHFDLVLIHRPPLTGVGTQLWEGLMRARDSGLTRHIGVSNYTIDQIDELASTGDMPAVNQIEWSPFGWSRRVLDESTRRGIVIQAYSPLTRARRLDDPFLGEIADRYGKSPAQLLVRWNLQLGVVPLPKASRLDHIGENADVFDFELNANDMAQLGDLDEQYSALSSLPYV